MTFLRSKKGGLPGSEGESSSHLTKIDGGKEREAKTFRLDYVC